MTNWQRLWTPNEDISRELFYAACGFWAAIWMVAWVAFKPAIFPNPVDVIAVYPDLWTEQGLGQALLASLSMNLEALVLSTAIALPLAYLSKTAGFSPLAFGAAKLRFLSPASYYMLLLFATSSGHELKLLMLTSGMVFYLLTSMLGVVSEIDSGKFDDARTLRMNEWAVTYYVVVRGTLHQALDAIRDNAAMGWAMVMMVEAIVRSEGGVGVMLTDATKHQMFAQVYAVVLAILALGIGMDQALTALRQWACPYASMATR